MRSFCIVAAGLFVVCFCVPVVRGDILRWDNGEVIPGTEGRELTPGSDFSGLNLAYADIAPVWLSDVDLSNTDLMRSDFSGARVFGVNLSQANLSEADLTGAEFHGVHWNGADVADARIEWSMFSSDFAKEQLYSTVSYQENDLKGIWFAGIDLSGWSFEGQNLSQSLFSIHNNVVLADADFTGAIVNGAHFDGLSREQLYSTASYQAKDLSGISLRDNGVSDWDFRNQNLSRAYLSRLTVANSDFTGAIVNYAWLHEITKNQLYSTASYQEKDLTGLVLGGDFAGLDLRDQNLTNAQLDVNEADLSGAVIRGANLSNVSAQQLYSTASYRAQDLRGIRLSFAAGEQSGLDLRGQNLANADVFVPGDADLSDAIVLGARLSISKEQLYSTASYKAQDLRGFHFDERDFTGGNLQNQDLTRANLQYADLSHADFSHANLTNGSMMEANLTGASLENANFFGTDLRGSIGFAPVATTKTRNVILPDGTIRGLDLRPGETLFMHKVQADRKPVKVEQELVIADGAVWEFAWDCVGIGCYVSRVELEKDVPIELGGTLRVVGEQMHINTGATWDIIHWSEPLAPGNVFSSIELPVGDWDTSRLYIQGEITLKAKYRGDGDFNVDDHWDHTDIDRLSAAVRGGRDMNYDLDSGLDYNRFPFVPRVLDQRDRMFWVHEIKETWFGDSNLDGEFNTGDLVQVFQAGQYEDEIAMNSGWAQGDWNGDGDFDTSDLVFAFQDGGYERGPLHTFPVAVPEPASSMVFCGGIGLAFWRRRRFTQR